MTDVLEQGAAWLDDQRHKHMTRKIAYQRGTDAVSIQATVGRSEFEQVDEHGVVHKIQSRDFLVRTEDLVLAGTPTLPMAGDRIHEPEGVRTYVYEVMAPGTEPPYRYSDPYRRALRIHTKHVATN